MAEKSHQPTAKKLRDARRRGEVAKSKDVTSLALYVSTLLCLWLGATWFGRRFAAMVEHAIGAPHAFDGRDDWLWLQEAQAVLYAAGTTLLPLLLVGLASAVLASLLQTRGLFSLAPLTIRFERLSPGKGLKELFSSRQLFQVVKLVVYASLLVVILFGSALASLDGIVKTIHAPPDDLLRIAGAVLFGLMGWAAVVYVAGAALDYAHQVHAFLKDQRMTTDELRREYRETEGDPWQKSHRRQTARDLAMSEMVSRVEDASVVLVNPTHVSVALYFAKGRTDLPKVVAKGVDAVALRIRTRAEQSGVPVFEDVRLARQVFRQVPLDQYINEGLIDAIAAVFRWARSVDRRGTT